MPNMQRSIVIKVKRMKKLALLLFFTATLSASDNMLPKKTKHSYVDLASPKDPSTWEGIRQELKAKIPALKSPARWADIEPHQGQSETNQEDFNSLLERRLWVFLKNEITAA